MCIYIYIYIYMCIYIISSVLFMPSCSSLPSRYIYVISSQIFCHREKEDRRRARSRPGFFCSCLSGNHI